MKLYCHGLTLGRDPIPKPAVLALVAGLSSLGLTVAQFSAISLAQDGSGSEGRGSGRITMISSQQKAASLGSSPHRKLAFRGSGRITTEPSVSETSTAFRGTGRISPDLA
ncbi:hypothetical protein XM38_038070 [Halomicronema hongdechloris C2206]|uniref:Uncharacterized protein n=1 Tax=Halomicronema hongdechloris C2206 TaxID=1641165 RepID=A0A1Z3HRT9_9CYAN|nr:hypothetical protein [Halomicronema hongdechloris]ASC72847.1 hypothetical protein XM38_038070 [Halomicronema hongdechloris C2206]